MSYSFDANVLLYASDEGSEFHNRAKEFLMGRHFVPHLAEADDLPADCDASLDFFETHVGGDGLGKCAATAQTSTS